MKELSDLSDEELQKLLENKSYPDVKSLLTSNEEAKVYELVFEELKKEPDFMLPADFADKVTEKVWKQENTYSFLTANTLLIISIVSALIISISAIAFVNMAFLNSLWVIFLNFKWLILFSLITLILIELGDKWLVRRKINWRASNW